MEIKSVLVEEGEWKIEHVRYTACEYESIRLYHGRKRIILNYSKHDKVPERIGNLYLFWRRMIE